MLEGNENNKIIPTELIFDNYFQKGLSIGEQAKYFPKENIEKENIINNNFLKIKYLSIII